MRRVEVSMPQTDSPGENRTSYRMPQLEPVCSSSVFGGRVWGGGRWPLLTLIPECQPSAIHPHTRGDSMFSHFFPVHLHLWGLRPCSVLPLPLAEALTPSAPPSGFILLPFRILEILPRLSCTVMHDTNTGHYSR